MKIIASVLIWSGCFINTSCALVFWLKLGKGKREKGIYMEILVSVLSGILAIATSVNMVGDHVVSLNALK